MSIPTIIEIALLLVVVFLIGCIIGWFLRTKMFTSPVAARSGSSSTQPTSAPPPAARQTAPSQTAKPAPKEVPASTPKQAPKSAPLPKSASPAKPRPAAVTQPENIQKEAEQPTSSALDPISEDAARPQSLSGPREGGKDDLKKIKGIGPKLESRLNEMGIYHFDQIAGWKKETIDWVDEHLSFKGRIDRDQWIKQAAQLSKK